MEHVIRQPLRAAAPEKRRIAWLDTVRTLAIFCVMLCHCIETAYDLNLREWYDAGIISKAFRLCGFTFGRLGVPLFLFLTGYLMLGRRFADSRSIIDFYKKKLPPLLTAVVFWNCFNFFFLCIYNGTEPNWRVLRRVLLFLGPAPLSLMWYIPMIIGIYIAVPFINRAIAGISVRALYLPLTVCFGVGFIVPFINLMINIYGDQVPIVASTVHVAYLGGAYGFYLLLGHIFRIADHQRIRTRVFAPVFLLSFAGMCGFCLFAYSKGNNYWLWYDFPLMPPCALSLFALFYRLRDMRFFRRTAAQFAFAAQHAFAVFFIHSPVQLLSVLLLENVVLKKPYAAAFVFIVGAILSFALAWALRKVKFIRQWLLGG